MLTSGGNKVGEVVGLTTGVPRSSKMDSAQDPTVGLCLGLYRSPRGGEGCYERDVPVTPSLSFRNFRAILPKDGSRF